MRPGNDRPCRPAGGALCFLLLVCLCAPARADDSLSIEHVVIIWLNEAGNADHRARILAESRVLTAIPGVTGLRGGSVVTSGRAIVDSSYDVALIVSVRDRAALDGYLVHPLHLRLVNDTLKPLVKRIQVYDFRLGL